VVKMFPLKWDRYRFHRPKFDSHILYVLYLLSYAKAVQDGVFILAVYVTFTEVTSGQDVSIKMG